MTPTEWAVAGGVALALLGAGSFVFDGLRTRDQLGFVGYLVALLLGLAGVGVVLAMAL